MLPNGRIIYQAPNGRNTNTSGSWLKPSTTPSRRDVIQIEKQRIQHGSSIHNSANPIISGDRWQFSQIKLKTQTISISTVLKYFKITFNVSTERIWSRFHEITIIQQLNEYVVLVNGKSKIETRAVRTKFSYNNFMVVKVFMYRNTKRPFCAFLKRFSLIWRESETSQTMEHH